jgi:hypothetical protein
MHQAYLSRVISPPLLWGRSGRSDPPRQFLSPGQVVDSIPMQPGYLAYLCYCHYRPLFWRGYSLSCHSLPSLPSGVPRVV